VADLRRNIPLESTTRQGETRPLTIWWSLVFNTTSEVKARKLMGRVLTTLGLPTGEIGYDRDSEAPSQYKAAFTTEVAVSSDDPRVAVYEVLRLASRLGCWWSVSPPHINSTGLGFHGVLAPPQRFSISGLIWASFDVPGTPLDDGAGDDPSVPAESDHPPR
jgi:hypothetical protein